LSARLAENSAASLDGGASTPGAASALGWPTLVGLAAAVALIGGGIWQLRQPESEPSIETLRPALARLHAQWPVAVTPTLTPEPLEPAKSAEASVATRSLARGAPTRPASGLAEEVALLSRAESALHGGRFVKALGALDEYERKFPRGALVQEDVSARVQALCGLGRTADAKQQLRRLSPDSPHASRARAACGAALKR